VQTQAPGVEFGKITTLSEVLKSTEHADRSKPSLLA